MTVDVEAEIRAGEITGVRKLLAMKKATPEEIRAMVAEGEVGPHVLAALNER